MSREMRWVLAAVGSVLLLAGLVVGFLPVEASYRLGGMSRGVTVTCGSVFEPRPDVVCVDPLSGRLTLLIAFVVLGVAVLAAWGAVSYLRSRDDAQAA